MSAPKSAFPLHPGIQADWDQAAGMTLRDWFAGQALGAYIASLATLGEHPSRYAEECASEAYAFADAMLAARGEPA